MVTRGSVLPVIGFARLQVPGCGLIPLVNICRMSLMSSGMKEQPARQR
jgi:hypothetical protein